MRSSSSKGADRATVFAWRAKGGCGYPPPTLSALPHQLRTSLRSLALALVALAGCQPEIGDRCRRASDCSIRGDRQCDLSYASLDPSGRGECTIENCSFGSCPSEAACIKVYGSEFLSVSCDPSREDVALEDPDIPGEFLPAFDDCNPAEVCLPEGLCADELSARTSCRRRCKRDRDCRGGYECVRVGDSGVYRADDPDDPTAIKTVRVCRPAR